MRDRAHEQVVAALIRLGCGLAREDQWHVTLVRGAAIIQHVPKTPLVPVAVQRRILHAFSFTDAEFLSALANP